VDTGGSGYSLHIFFNRADTVTAERMGRLLAILEEELPEALPHRYDHIEPAQHRWAEGGREAFLGRWDRQDCPFWIGKTPAGYVYASFDYKPSRVPPAFRAGRFNFQFRAKLGEQPAKLLGVLRVAERFAMELDAFYTGVVAGNEIHGPYWKGLIPTNHLLLILGEPLFALWPEFDGLSSPLGDQHRRAGGSDLGTVSLRPPEAMCYPQHQPRAEPVAPNIGGPYAARFPFPKLDPYLG
jgi:hypothetical protein